MRIRDKVKVIFWKIKAFFKGDCYSCLGEATWYGLAPRSHSNRVITSFLPESEWPSNYYPLEENAGEWHCKECGGTGKRERNK